MGTEGASYRNFSNELGVKRMVIQSTVFPDEVCGIDELYFRTTGKIEKKRIVLHPGEIISTDTYMNALDAGHWSFYTTVCLESLYLAAAGTFSLSVCQIKQGKTTEICRQEYRTEDCCEKNILLPQECREGILYWSITAISDTVFYSADYLSRDTGRESGVKIAVDICTYYRKMQLEKNLKTLCQSAFFQPESPMYGKLRISVTDNGGDFTVQEPDIQIYKNSNKGGGTGGFTRGLLEMNERYQDYPYTHMIFMDDDVEFQIESFYRLFAFLSLLKKEYQRNPIAGRMFRADRKKIQYTAAEQWNQGRILHIEGNLDMSLRENLKEEAGITGEYGGWWFCCYPASITRKYRPFPFFLHCDDAEYGLRQKRETLILRGVQVWHETFEYRMSPSVIYYDIRNALIVNAVMGNPDTYRQMVSDWRQRTTDFHNQGDQTMKFISILAMWDFLGGKVGEQRRGKISEISLKISKMPGLLKVISPFFRRITEKRIKTRLEKAAEIYKERMDREIWQ